MATYTVVNGSDEQLASINGGGTNVDAYCYKDGITLTNTELATLLSSSFGKKNVAVFADLSGDSQAAQRKRSAFIGAFFLST